MIRIKTPKDIETMRASCLMASEVLLMLTEHIKDGITTMDINNIAHEYIIKNGGYPSTLNYNGYPRSVCVSPNEVVCHGIPSKKTILKNGDIVNVDVTVFYKGFHGDTSRMYTIGNISLQAQRLLEVAEEAMYVGIAAVDPEKRLGDVGHAIQTYVEQRNFSVVRDYIGHGIGRDFHEDPQVHHVGKPDHGVRLRPGMTFTIEPMINQGKFDVHVLKDNWTVVTNDRRLSAQFEHTVVVTETGHEILTLLPGVSAEDRLFAPSKKLAKAAGAH